MENYLRYMQDENSAKIKVGCKGDINELFTFWFISTAPEDAICGIPYYPL
jgi:hypothetical protein